MSQAIRIKQPGGVEALSYDTVDPGKPGPGEVLIRQNAIGVNFIDIYHRTGLYKLPSYPAGIGMEAAGVVEEAGQGASLKPGDRVVYAGGPVGSYASHRVMAEKFLVKLPANVSDEVAASVMLKGLTADYLLRHTFVVEKGQVVLIHAAAGGVGVIMGQWAKHLGATVIGTAGSDEKAALAKQYGYDHVIVYTRENIAERVKEITGGAKCHVVYDSVGKSTFMDSLDSLRKFGMLVSFGNASGAIPAFEPLLLSQKGSLYFTRPSLVHHIEDTDNYRAYAAELFDLVGKGIIKVPIHKKYKLSDAREAHTDLEGRKTSGALILVA